MTRADQYQEKPSIPAVLVGLAIGSVFLLMVLCFQKILYCAKLIKRSKVAYVSTLFILGVLIGGPIMYILVNEIFLLLFTITLVFLSCVYLDIRKIIQFNTEE